MQSESPNKDQDPANGLHLSLKERLELSEQLLREAEALNPFPRYKPFVKSFESFEEYEQWRKQQRNPWLI